MENDPSFKQLIPYCSFRHGDQLLITKEARHREGRLHSLWSVGVGGHISSQDQNLFGSVAEAMHREIGEEVFLETTYQDTCGPVNAR